MSQARIRGRYRFVSSFEAAVSPTWARSSRLCRVSFIAPSYHPRAGHRKNCTFSTNRCKVFPLACDLLLVGDQTRTISSRPISLSIGGYSCVDLNGYFLLAQCLIEEKAVFRRH